jgi:hypothetical protein
MSASLPVQTDQETEGNIDWEKLLQGDIDNGTHEAFNAFIDNVPGLDRTTWGLLMEPFPSGENIEIIMTFHDRSGKQVFRVDVERKEEEYTNGIKVVFRIFRLDGLKEQGTAGEESLRYHNFISVKDDADPMDHKIGVYLFDEGKTDLNRDINRCAEGIDRAVKIMKSAKDVTITQIKDGNAGVPITIPIHQQE